MASPKPVPTHLKIVRGNPGKRPLNKDEPTFSAEMPVAPDWLSARAKEIFALLATRLNEMGYASASHTEALALAAMRQAEVEACDRALAKGLTYKVRTTSGAMALKARPEVAIRAEASRHLQSLLSEFGLTPSAATKIIVPRRQGKNPFKAL